MTGDEHDDSRAARAGGGAFDANRILYHGHGLLVVDKPAGVPVIRGTKHDTGLVELLDAWITANPEALDVRPGTEIHPAHRLEREASGVQVLAVKSSAARKVQAAFQSHDIGKRYLAVVAGPMPAEGRVRGKVRTRLRDEYRWMPAELVYRRVRGDERLSILEIFPKEGRTHAVRSLLAGKGRPLAGDLRYGKPKPAEQFLERFRMDQLLLHALEVRLPAEILGHETSFVAPVPDDFQRLCREKGWEELVLDEDGEL